MEFREIEGGVEGHFKQRRWRRRTWGSGLGTQEFPALVLISTLSSKGISL